MCCHFVWQAKSSRTDTAIVLRSRDCYCWSPQARLSSKSAKRRNLNLTLAHTHAGSSPRQEVSCWYTIKCLLKINLKVSAASVNLADWVMTVPSGGVTKRPRSALVNDLSFFFVNEYQNKMWETCYYSALTKWVVSGWKLIQQIEKGVKCFCPIDSDWNGGYIKHSFLSH